MRPPPGRPQAVAARSVRHLAHRLVPRRYNYTLSRPGSFLYVRVAKVATGSLSAWLRAHEGLDLDYVSRKPLPRGNGSLFVFGFVRNPWDRLVSAWADKARPGYGFELAGVDIGGLSFEDFVSFVATLDLNYCDRHVRRQVALMPTRRLDFVGRYESLPADIERLGQTIDLDSDLVPHLNRNRARQEYQAYYSPALRDLVADLYAADIGTFGYAFDG